MPTSPPKPPNLAAMGPVLVLVDVDGNRRGKRTNIPGLRHSCDTTSKIACQKRQNGRETPWQLGWHIPNEEVVSLLASEPLVLNQEDEGERHSPVSKQRHEVADDGRQVLSARNSQDGNHERVDKRPDETRHGVEVVAEQLHAETGGVIDCDVVPQHREDEEHQAELREAERVEGLSDQAAEAVIGVGS
jgi:hypothetical protein